MRELLSKNIEEFYDLFDSAVMLLYDCTHIDYLDGIKRIYNDIFFDFDSSNLDNDKIKELLEIESKIENINILNEEIRQALLLLIIKGYKHRNLSAEVFLPDTITLFFTFLVRELLTDIKDASILDVNLGLGNLVNTILNNIDFDIKAYGFERDLDTLELAVAFSNLQGNEILIYNNSPIDEKLFIDCDLVIGALENSNENGEYLPYKIITHYLNQYMIFLVDNDFFSHQGSNELKDKVDGYIAGLITLPDELFKDKGKSIIILRGQKSSKGVEVFNMPSLKNNDKLKDFYKDLVCFLNDIKEEK